MALAERDQRIDFLRGCAVIVICLDHISGNVLREWTPLAWGYSDMSEVFVFLSGLVTSRSMDRRAAQDGLYSAVLSVWGRSARLYVYYLVVGVVLLLVTRVFFPTEVQQIHRAGALTYSSRDLAVSIGLFQQHVSLLAVLPLYVILLMLYPVVYVTLRPWPQGWFILSLVVYLAGLLLSGGIPEPYWTAIYFQPVGWGGLFLAGAAVGRQFGNGWTPRTFARLSVAAWLVLAFLSVVSEQPWVAQLRFKWTPGPLRVLHFSCVAIVAAYLLPEHAGWYSEKIRSVGRNSLAVYLGGAFLAVALSALLRQYPGWWAQGVVNALGFAGCLLIAHVAGMRRCP